jgi:hypothetical protein
MKGYMIMTIEEKVKKLYMKKLTIWAIITAVLFAICFIYHKISDTDFAPVVSVSLIMLISFIVFNSMGLLSYFTDKSFSGTITHIKIDVRLYKESAFDKKIEKRIYVGMTIECDDGKAIFFEQMLPIHLTNTNPYREGDRVYHIKGAKYTCRFPRNDTVKQYDPISIICPLCGAVNDLGTHTCVFCENDLPWDPQTK